MLKTVCGALRKLFKKISNCAFHYVIITSSIAMFLLCHASFGIVHESFEVLKRIKVLDCLGSQFCSVVLLRQD